MTLMKHVVDENGVGQDVEMAADEEAEFLASLPAIGSPIPQSITRRQCARGMLARGLITAAEALAMTKSGEPPAMVASLLAQMAPDQAVLAEIDFAADTYLRSNPLLVSLMEATGATSADIDAFFVEASAL